MAKKGMGLGRGFDSLIPTDWVEEAFDPTREEDESVSQLVELKVSEVQPDKNQPRRNFSEEGLNELADSIREHGVVSPIVVVKKGEKYEIVAGERRWRASKLAEKETIPAIVRTLSDQNRLELAIIENAQREDLGAIELATAYAKLKNQFNLSDDEIAKRVGKSKTGVVNTMRLLKLPEEVKHAMQEHHLPEGPMRPLISADPELVKEALPRIIQDGWSTRAVERFIATKKKKSSVKAVKENSFVKEEAKLCKKYGAEVRVRGRSVTFGVKSDAELRKLLEKF